MDFISRQLVAAEEPILTPLLTLKGHMKPIPSISCFADGKQMTSGSYDGTVRRWDLEAGKEIKVQDVYEQKVDVVAVSRDGQWVGMGTSGDVRVCEVEAGIVRRFEGPTAEMIRCMDISTDSKLLAVGAYNYSTEQIWIWSLDSGKLVATFEIDDWAGAIRFSQDSKKIAVLSNMTWLEIWDVQTQKLDVQAQVGTSHFQRFWMFSAPVFWTTKDKTIVTVFGFTDSHSPNTIYEFDASTLVTVGTPFKGHTKPIDALALSFDCALLASASRDGIIKLWAFESRQLLASFRLLHPNLIIFLPDSRQLAYTIGYNIYLCDTPPAQQVPQRVQLTDMQRQLYNDILMRANRRPALDPPSTTIPPVVSLLPLSRSSSPAIGSRLPQSYPHPRELLPSSSHTDTVLPIRDPSPDAMLHDLTGYITKDGDYPVARGGFGEIWKCTYSTDQISIKVAVKSLQVYAADQLGAAKAKKIKRITRELKICAKLKHKNILSVYGYTDGFGPFIAMVSPWAENGNLTAYLERVGADLTVLRRFQILRDIIAGLRYLHANSVIHGDFNGPNVLIHGDGTACVADFGLSFMHSEVISASQASWTSTLKGNMRWMAPELLVPEQEDGTPTRPSKQSDIFSFGGIMLQVLTNKIPYYYLPNDAAIVLCIARSETPSRSRYPVLLEKYWQFIEQCWSTNPRDRPSTEAAKGVIRNELNEFYSLSRFH